MTVSSTSRPVKGAPADRARASTAAASIAPFFTFWLEHITQNRGILFAEEPDGVPLAAICPTLKYEMMIQALRTDPLLRTELKALLEAQMTKRGIHIEVFTRPGNDVSLFVRAKPPSFFASIPPEHFLPLLTPSIELFSEGGMEARQDPEGYPVFPKGSMARTEEYTDAMRANPNLRTELGKLLEAHFAERGVDIEVFTNPESNLSRLLFRARNLSATKFPPEDGYDV